MRRRPRSLGEEKGIPRRLLHWEPADWTDAPGVDCGHPECAYWAARERFQDAHPELEEAWLGVSEGPDTPFHAEWI